MSDVQCLIDAGNHLGESPIWSAAEQALWWINCEQPPELHRWHAASGEHRVWPMPKRIGGFVHKAGGGLLVVLADGIYDFDPAIGDCTLRAANPLPSHVKLHECHCDRQGRFWVGSYDHHFPADRSAKGGCWFRLDGIVLTPVIEGISVANGLAFSPDGRTMYTANTSKRTVEARDLDPATGGLSNPRTFLTLPLEVGHIDGATVDSEGGYWLALVAAGKVRRYRPDGVIDRDFALPCSNPTKPAFGGADMATLFVTSTKMAIRPDLPGEDANGAVFALRPGFDGIAETPFAD
jgi:L-arabinonolactonase